MCRITGLKTTPTPGKYRSHSGAPDGFSYDLRDTLRITSEDASKPECTLAVLPLTGIRSKIVADSSPQPG